MFSLRLIKPVCIRQRIIIFLGIIMLQPHGEAFLNKKKELKSQAGFGFLIKSLLYNKWL